MIFTSRWWIAIELLKDNSLKLMQGEQVGKPDQM
jgi:hypothetical protein